MFSVVEDLRAELLGANPLRLVVVEEAPEYPGALIFQVVEGEQAFYSRYREWVSRHLVLGEIFSLDSFIERLERDGWQVLFDPSCRPILDDHARWSQPLEIEGYDLHQFQQYALQKALERPFFFWNWATGAGKTFCSAAGAKELFSQKEIDLVLALTPAPLKIGLFRFFQRAGLDVVLNEGGPAKRRKTYQQDHQGFVLNYERLRVDEKELTELITGKRVLWVLDEVHRVLAGQHRPNQARKAFDRLVRLSAAKVWPMSATVVDGDPLKYRDVFSLTDRPRYDHPLGTMSDFTARYASTITKVPIRTRNRRTVEVTYYEWNTAKLQEVRHRVGELTHSARKTDPALAPLFQGMQTVEVPVVLSDEDRRLYEIIVGHAEQAWANGENLAPFYRLMRYVCLTPQALAHTDEAIGAQIADEHPKLITSAHSAKLAMVNEMLEGFREAGDKVVMFCHWTQMGLHLITDHLTVPWISHSGDQSASVRQGAIDRFQADPNLTVLFSSDAGAYGLNLTAARVVIQLDPVYSFDLAAQRAARIDRVDSHLNGLSNFQYLTEDSVEERIWNIQQQRRRISAAVQGTVETVDYQRATRSETENLAYLVLGHG